MAKAQCTVNLYLKIRFKPLKIKVFKLGIYNAQRRQMDKVGRRAETLPHMLNEHIHSGIIGKIDVIGVNLSREFLAQGSQLL